MALPTSMIASQARTQTGIVLGVHPSTEGTFNTELRVSTQSSTASTNWVTQQLDPTSGYFTHTVPLPLSTRTYYFQARHTGIGYGNGSYTPVVSAKPVKIALGGTPKIARGKSGAVEIPLGDVWLTSGQTAKVGTQATTASITKKIRIPGFSFTPAQPGVTYSHSLGTVTGTATTGGSALVSQYSLPRNIIITKWRAFVARRTTGSTCTMILYRLSSAGIGSTIATLATTVNAAAQTKESSALSLTVDDTRALFAQATLRSNPTPNDGIIFWTEFDYKMRTYKDNL